MKQHPPDAELSVEVERLVEALRADLPAASDAARVRNRLIAAGVLAAGFGSSLAAAATAKSGFPVAAAQASESAGSVANLGGNASTQLLQGATQATLQGAGSAPAAGMLAKIIALPAAIKVGAGGGLIALALGTAPVLEQRWKGVRDHAVDREQPTQQLAARPRVVVNDAAGSTTKAPLAETAVPDAVQAAKQGINYLALRSVNGAVPAKIESSPEPLGVAQRGQGSKKSLSLVAPADVPGRTDRAEKVNSGSKGFSGALADDAVSSERVATVSVYSLKEETPLISRALQALKAGDVDGARAALSEHERRFPAGLLSPERERMRSKLLQ